MDITEPLMGGGIKDILEEEMMKFALFLLVFSLIFGYLPSMLGVYDYLGMTRAKNAVSFLKLVDICVMFFLLFLTIICFGDFFLWEYILDIMYVGEVILSIMVLILIIAIIGYYNRNGPFMQKHKWIRAIWAFCYFMYTTIFGFGVFRLFFGCGPGLKSIWTMIVYILMVIGFFIYASREENKLEKN